MSDSAAKVTSASKRTIARSPAYPSISLEDAVKKAEELHRAEGKYAVPMHRAYSVWGYGAKSSGARLTRAAMRYYGLLTMEGDGDTGTVKLSEDALRVILDRREDQSEKKAIIRRMALAPTVFKKLAEWYPEGVKSIPSAQHRLVFEAGFNERAADELLVNFLQTAQYAELFQSDSVANKADDGVTGEVLAEKPITPPPYGAPPPQPPAPRQVKIMESERVVFTEEGLPNQYLKLIASGEIDSVLLEALEDFVKRHKKRLAIANSAHSPQ